MNRYSQIDIINNVNENIRTLGIPYYKPNFYPEIPKDSSDIYIITEFGDRLEFLANQFYKDTTLFWIISSANPDDVNFGSFFITEGTQLRIPLNINNIIDSYKILNNT